MEEEDGLTIALSPVQLATVLEGESLSEEDSTSNRVWGTLGVVFGVFELVGAGGLLAVPEPTLATKAGGLALGAHGLDTIQSNARQVWSGRTEHSLTHDGAAALARSLGADEATANMIGTGVDVAVPVIVSLGVGAARVAAIRGGRISLIEHEAQAGSRLGGHTIREHVGKTEAYLRQRMPGLIARNPRLQAVSTFRTLADAEKAISKCLLHNRAAITQWASTARAGQRSAPFIYRGSETVGFGIETATGLARDMRGVRLILKMETYGSKPYYILTAFPIL